MSDQEEYGPPISGDDRRKSEKFLPRFFRTDSNSKFLAGTMDPLIQSGSVQRLNGFIGRKNAKSVTVNDVFLDSALKDRSDYQLEPSLVAEDNLGNVTFFKDYIDYINTIDVLGGINNNHQRLNQQEFYSWSPQIDWDKIVNFLRYYWLPFGPEVIGISGSKVLDTTSTFTVITTDEGDNFAYLFTPDGLTRNPRLRLYRGETYKFDITAPNDPFSIKTDRLGGNETRYTKGVSAHAVTNGIVEFKVPFDAPDLLYYVSENAVDTAGIIEIYDIKDNSQIDVEEEIIGKKHYTVNGVELTNGMKIRFNGLVTPEQYVDTNFYVEGVGEAIKLIDERDLQAIGDYTGKLDVNYDSYSFDELPFNNVNHVSVNKDYITINRASRDRNPWTRHNRWVHEEVINRTAKILGKQPVFDQTQRAIRPIIEFKANLKLFNFGSLCKNNIDFVDNFTRDAFSTVEGSLGYYIDGVQLLNGHRVIFNAETDPRVKNKVYKVEYLEIFDEFTTEKKRRIHLVEEPDSLPNYDDVVLVLSGVELSGQMFWFDGVNWVQAQTKSKVNQPPLFDLFDKDGVSLSDISRYEGTTFRGNTIFSYKVGRGTSDTELGFALTYRNINNIGDILFEFDLLQENYSYKINNEIVTENTDNKFLKIYSSVGEEKFINGWVTCQLENVQPIVRIYKKEMVTRNGEPYQLTNYFPIDVFDDKENLEDLHVKVYVNNKRVDPKNFNIVDGIVYKEVELDNDIDVDDVVYIRCFTKRVKNSNGHYEFPINFQNNTLNLNITDFTLGEVTDHVDSIVNNCPLFDGNFPGNNNLRDIANLSTYGTKFVQHTGSINLALYHLTSKSANIIKALDKARDDYGKFKRAFIYNYLYIEDGTNIKDAVDFILFNLNSGKSKSSPYYFSDVLGYTAHKKLEYTVKDPRTKNYPLISAFSLETLSTRSVNIYLNKVQLLHELDYVFTDEGFVQLSCYLEEDDLIEIYDYASTDGCFVPPTPTSLGLYPRFEPKKYLDTTLVEPKFVLQGHDGSITLAYNDFRDDLILELERRIFNNIKSKYDPNILDIYDFIPGYNRPTAYNLEELNQILAPNFFTWTTLVDNDFTKPILVLKNKPFTFNYSEATSFDNTVLPGFWRAIYKYYFDTDRVHLCPWESLGFTLKPKWWDDVYGPAPYTSNNLILWNDVIGGVIREPNRPVLINKKFIRPNIIPVDDEGKLLDPIQMNIILSTINARLDKGYVFGDQGPVETAWRRSSYYPFSLLKTMILMQPNRVLGCFFDRSRLVRNKAGQIVYDTTGLRLKLSDIVLPNIINDTKRYQTAGLINYVIEYLNTDNTQLLVNYKNDLQVLTNKLSHRIGGFTSKEKYNLILDSKSANATSGVFVSKENYKIILNTSSPVKKLFYSGVIVTKLLTETGVGYEIKGYSQTEPYFTYYPWTQVGYVINVGGVSESYIKWESAQRYIVGNIVKIDNDYYRVKTSHTSSTNPDYDYLQKLSSLPIIGGADAFIRPKFDRIKKVLNYGTILNTIQEVVDFLQGYSEYLKDQNFVFDEFNQDLKVVTNWDHSVKEFLFWTTQNWSTGIDTYVEWDSFTSYNTNEIVYYEGEFFKTKTSHLTENTFNPNLYYKIDELNSDGAAAISLSPSALKLDLALNFYVVDDLRETSNVYEIFQADGKKYDPQQLEYVRKDNVFSLKPNNTDVGIYGAGLYLVQKEHVLLIDNVSQFNDTIYNIETGYRQEKIKIAGYKTTNWNGGFDAPGFIYDRAYINEWQTYTDYNVGDIVKYKEFYYTANIKIVGTDSFDNRYWSKLDSKPESQLLPNWDYKALQFTDFYDLDSDNFDVGQQRVAQHLIGYQKRDYLENIIKNSVSEFKFYQGMITEKGTVNSLNKLFDVLSAADQDSLDFVEEWAIRIGNYGSNDAFEEIEFILDEKKFKIEPQAFELVSTIDNKINDFVIRQTRNDVYLKPKNYSNNLWPVQSNYRPFLKSPGFVRLDQVQFAIDKKTDILAANIDLFTSGDYIWCAFESKINQFGDNWCVYRFSHLDLNVTDVKLQSNSLFVTFNIRPNLVVGDIIGFKSDHAPLNKFFTVAEVTDKIVKITENVSGITVQSIDKTKVKTFKITTSRFDSIDNLEVPKFLKPVKGDWLLGELVWFKNPNGLNTIWQNQPVYTTEYITENVLTNGSKFGSKIAINKDATVFVSSSQDKVTIFKRPNGSRNWIRTQGIEAKDVQNFAKSLTISDDGQYIGISGYLEYTDANNDLVKNGVVHVYRLSTGGEYDRVDILENPELKNNNPLIDEFFGYKIKFTKQGANYKLFVSSTNGVSISGKIYVFNFTTSWQYLTKIQPTTDIEEPFAYDFDVNQTGTILTVSSCLNEGGKVFIYELTNNSYTRRQSLDLPNDTKERFGFSLAFSDSGQYLAISSSTETLDYYRQGRIRIYSKASDVTYTLLQIIDNRNAEPYDNLGEQYGYFIKFANNEKTLVVYSKYGSSSIEAIIGEDSTVINSKSGRIDVYDRYISKFVFSESLPVGYNDEQYGVDFDVGDNAIVVGAPNTKNTYSGFTSGVVYFYNKFADQYSWRQYLEEKTKVDIGVFKKIFTYNRKTNTLLNYLDIIDPVQGRIATLADKELKYKTYYDPAIYSYQADNNTFRVNIDDGMCWLEQQVGTLWWDLTRAKFLDSTMGDLIYRNFTWNRLYPTASIDIYEWVESRLTPDQWDALSGTEDGVSRGITGTTRYGNKVYSIKRRYDSISKSFVNIYYYWVKDKTNVPAVNGRSYGILDVKTLIEDPKSYGLKYIQFLDHNSLSVVNLKNDLNDTDVALSIQYWTVPENKRQSIHSEWKIISENEKTEIPSNIERKWIDSLVGFDENGRGVPDTQLSPKQKYGIEFRPIQSMFVNRIEAVKQVIERFNLEMKPIQIDNIDISDLLRNDPLPSEISGRYDYIKDTEKELRFITADAHVIAQLEPIISFGRIVGVNILNAGYGYKFPPTIKVTGGVGAELKAELLKDSNGNIDPTGRIVNVKVIESGNGYDSSTTTITVRPLTALVLSDTTTLGYWALYSYDPIGKRWLRTKTQEYDVTLFWNYIDWYEEGYNQFTKVDFNVDSIDDIFVLAANIGQVVKVSKPGSDWLLLEKYSNNISIDYTKTYRVVGRQNGTIQLSDKFYNNSRGLGYDGSLYDSFLYDSAGTRELRIILNSLKDKILIDDKRKIYLDLFFVSIRYLLYEQPFVDWVFKTSFIKALHNVGQLRQKVSYSNDNLPDFEKYIKEVKPYRTKIREFVSIYNNLENTNSIISDFDLPSYIDNFQIKSLYTQYNNGIVTTDNRDILKQEPWSFWKKHLGFSVQEIVISDNGKDYIDKPLIRFEGTCIRPAQAVAYIVRRKLVKIDIIDQGEGYFVSPRVIIDGNVDKTGRQAKAYAVIGSNLVRSNHTELRFDRYTKKSFDQIKDIIVVDTFEADGINNVFTLRYKPSSNLNTLKVEIGKSAASFLEVPPRNVEELIVGTYTVDRLISTERGHTVHYGVVTLTTIPEDNSVIKITYQKDFVHLNALDRIFHFYKPESGMIGRDFGQLMTGIDYGGVIVTGLGFEKEHTWDGEYGWEERPWDSSVLVNDSAYDTLISAGDLTRDLNPNSAYNTASGLLAEDIIIDGDGLITTMTSPAPEEMLPGHVVDTLAIKVVERRLTNSSEIITNNYVSDGINKDYKFTQYANNKDAIIVKVDEDIAKPEIDYRIDFDNLTISFIVAPLINRVVSITTLGLNGENLLESTYQIIDKETIEIYTATAWQENIVAFTLVSGEIRNHELFKTDGTEYIANRVGIRFPFKLTAGQVVNYSIFIGKDVNQSLVSRETLTSDGVSKVYRLKNPVGVSIPLDPNVLVRVRYPNTTSDVILNSVDSFRFRLSARNLTYDIPTGKADINLFSLNDYIVYIAGEEVKLSIAYTLDLINSRINIRPNYYKDNAEVIVTITKEADYFIKNDQLGSRIEFRNPYPNNSEIEVISMYNHDILGVERKYYKIEPNLKSFTNSVYYLSLVQVTAGIFSFDREVVSADYIWLVKNNRLLSPNIDYILLEGNKSVRVAGVILPTDRFSVITFSGNVARNPVSFMQFKDMMNKVHYKRLNKNRTTRLAQDLKQNDKEIFVVNPGCIGEPNKDGINPGVIYIDGERIEYFVKVGNRMTQLRRGTLGTGVPNIHKQNTEVYDIGSAETVPYEDEIEIIASNNTNYNSVTKTMTLPFQATKNNIEVFSSKTRLRKNSYMLHNEDIHPESPEGDELQPAEFTVTGNQVTLKDDSSIYVVVKKLKVWHDTDKSLSESNNAISYFLKFNVEQIPGSDPSIDSGLYSTDSDDLRIDEE